MTVEFQTLNPATGKVLQRFPQKTASEVKKRLAETEEVFRKNRFCAMGERAARMRVAADLLEHGQEHYARLITLEMGKPVAEARAEVAKCAWACRFYAEKAEEFLADEVIATDAAKSYIRYEPLGVILAIMPWNFPFWQVFRFAAPALMAGNACLLKHAPNVPRCALAIEALWEKAGFEKGLFRSLFVSRERVRSLIEEPCVKAITFTGSDRAGADVASIAGKNIKKVVLELGGSDPFIVLDDADPAHAASMATASRMLNGGQSCISAKRFIIHKKVYDAFAENLLRSFRALRCGDPSREDTQVGPLARSDLRDRLKKQVDLSVKKGAVVLTGGKSGAGEGFYYEPTILTGVKPGMPVFDEEVFGPVAALTSARDEGEALSLANHTSYGLGASVWTANEDRARFFAGRVDAGCLFVNGIVKSDPRLPFGGIKRSGYGRELGRAGILEFVNVKTVWMNFTKYE